MDHPTTDYARRVVSGEQVAGPHVRHSCQRHLNDLARSARGELPYVFDGERATKVFRFFEKVLRLPAPRESDERSMPFRLMDWERFILGNLFGWVDPAGMRRFRMAFVLCSKGSGKSAFAAGIGLYMTVADGEPNAQNFIIARDADQALIPMQACVNIKELTPQLDSLLHVRGGVDRPEQISCHSKGSWLRRVASDTAGKGHSGSTPHFVLCEEYHEHQTDAMLKFYDLGTKERRQPLIFVITNAGDSLLSPCGEEFEYACEVAERGAEGVVEDESYFSYVCALDEEDDVTEVGCWPKVLPGLPEYPPQSFVSDQLLRSKGQPSNRAKVERLLFCRWGAGNEAPWLTLEAWKPCEQYLAFDEAFLKDLPCYLSLDLGLKRDLSAGAAVWEVPLDDGEVAYWARIIAWTHEEDLRQRGVEDKIPYETFRDNGYLQVVPGRLMDFGYVAKWIYEMMYEYDVQGLCYDQWKMDLLKTEMEEVGIRYTSNARSVRSGELLIVPHNQSYRGWGADEKREKGEIPLFMPRSIDKLEEIVYLETLKVEFNPLLRYAVQAAVPVMDASANRRFEKNKQREKIDCAVALAMGVGFAAEGLPSPLRPFQLDRVAARI